MTSIQQIKQLIERAVIQSGCEPKELKIKVGRTSKAYQITAKNLLWHRDSTLLKDEVLIECPTGQEFRTTLK